MNKKGDEDLVLFFAFFFMLVLILGILFGGVLAFFGKGYDSRLAESEILLSKVQDCFLDKGDDFFKDGFSISECGLNENALEESHLVLVRDLSQEGREFFVGVYNYQNDCFFEASKENEDFPRCATAKIGSVEIVTGSNQNSRRIN